jgi:hypothetical protein
MLLNAILLLASLITKPVLPSWLSTNLQLEKYMQNNLADALTTIVVFTAGAGPMFQLAYYLQIYAGSDKGMGVVWAAYTTSLLIDFITAIMTTGKWIGISLGVYVLAGSYVIVKKTNKIRMKINTLGTIEGLEMQAPINMGQMLIMDNEIEDEIFFEDGYYYKDEGKTYHGPWTREIKEQKEVIMQWKSNLQKGGDYNT